MFRQHGLLRHSFGTARGQCVDAFHQKVFRHPKFGRASCLWCRQVRWALPRGRARGRCRFGVEQNGGPRHRFAIQDRPMDKGSAVLREQGPMGDGAQRGKFQTTSGKWKATTTPKSGAHIQCVPEFRRPALAGPEGAVLFRHHLHLGGPGERLDRQEVWGGHDAHDLVVRFQSRSRQVAANPGVPRKTMRKGSGECVMPYKGPTTHSRIMQRRVPATPRHELQARSRPQQDAAEIHPVGPPNHMDGCSPFQRQDVSHRDVHRHARELNPKGVPGEARACSTAMAMALRA